MRVDAAGDVYVADLSNHSVRKFDADGSFLTKWGSMGSVPGEFLDPIRVASDSDGRIYVADFHNYRVQKFDAEGAFVSEWGTFGTGPGEFDHCSGVAVNEFGHVYAADLQNFRVQKFVPGAASGVGAVVPAAELAMSSFPNPFRRLSTIRFDLSGDSPAALGIYDVRGALVRELVAGTLPPGTHRVTWNGRDAGGRTVAGGVYYARLRAGGAEGSLEISFAR